MRRNSLRRPACKAWKIALCSLSTGEDGDAADLQDVVANEPAMTSVSLLAKAMVLPRPRSRPKSLRTGTADDGREDDVDLGTTDRLGQGRYEPVSSVHSLGRADQSTLPAVAGSTATTKRGRNRVPVPAKAQRWGAAESTVAWRRWPEAAITSRALRPMLPVEPKTATLVS